ncbi:MAG: Peptidoglycan glycosyltransferase [Myxococcales bacterium]|nr:Peptidoglycan glycosyltransferase [Myxococcales bacterium]
MKATIKAMTPGIPHSARVRAYLTGAIVTTALCGVAWRAWALQIDEGDRYREMADRQHAMNVEIPAPRGDVIDTHGRPLAVSADADSIWANPREIRDVTDTADKLAKLIGEDPATLEAKLAGDRKFVWIDRHVTREIAQAVRAADLPGIEVAKEPRRWYPGGTVGGPVIGRADIDSRGLEGIELSMDRQLQGERGTGLALRDARGRRMFANGMAQPEPGATIQLSLDRSIQAIADKALADSVIAKDAKSGVVVVLDVATGRVLAMSSYPTFDPNAAGDHAGARNRPVTDAFEAGSVMKIFTVAAAIDEGTVRSETHFDLENGAMHMAGRRSPIRDTHPVPSLTVSEIIKHSSNVGSAKIALRLGSAKLYAALKKFGFGAKTKIELPGEQAGRIRDGSTWREMELATIAFGYGITVTPLQIAAGYAALGNGGVYHAPRVVERVVDSDGTVLYLPEAEPVQMVKPSTAETMRKIMATVFERGKEGGTAKDIIVPGFRCGGKTGTAHKYDPETRQYAPDKYLSSFAGLAPIDKPRIAIVVMIDEPRGGDYYGGLVAGPVFATVASETLRYLGVPGTSLVCPPTPPTLPGMLPYIDPTPKTCTIPAPKPVKPAVVKPGTTPEPPVIEQPAPVVAPVRGDHRIPDFHGMGMARALDLSRQLGIPLEVSGSGTVIQQDPAPGAIVSPGGVRLQFSDGNSSHAAPVATPL